MSASRRIWILERIPSLEDRIVERNTAITSLEEDIATLEAQKAMLRVILDDHLTLPANITGKPEQISEDLFRGRNRTALYNQLVEMAAAITSQESDHWDNIDTISTQITTLEGRVTMLNNNTIKDALEIANLKIEWRDGNQWMEFPNYPA